MLSSGGRRRFRATTVVLVWLLVVSGCVVLPAAAPSNPVPWWVAELAGGPKPDPEPVRESESAPTRPVASNAVPAAEVRFPEPASWRVTLGEAGTPATVATDTVTGTDAKPDELPVSVTPRTPAAAGESLRIEVLDRDSARRVNASGFAVTTSQPGEDGLLRRATESDDVSLPMSVEVDYAAFAEAYGGEYATRLGVVALPACALTEPLPPGCAPAGQPLPVENDFDGRRLVATVEDLGALVRPATPDTTALAAAAARSAELDDWVEADLAVRSPDPGTGDRPAEPGSSEPAGAGKTGGSGAADGAVVLAVTAVASGAAGMFAATPLSITGSWSVGAGTGEFSYSYPIDVPEPGTGSAPTVATGYSSGSVDGMTIFTNNQASQVGLGWSDFANAFIERRYAPCYETYEHEGHIWTADLCWKSWNATISLEGLSGTLIPIDADRRQWRVQNGDPNWRIERIGDPGATGVVGVHSGEYWKLIAPDGTQYWFGLHYNPDTGAGTEGGWWTRIFGDRPGNPCWKDGIGACNAVWRWMLDRVVDPQGNLTTYYYRREANRYDALNGMGAGTQYIRSGILSMIEYGGRAGTTLPPAARVVFGRQYRCHLLNGNCVRPTSRHTTQFPDVPTEQICDSGTSCPGLNSPSFFSGLRYVHVRTEVRVGSAWKPVAQHNIVHTFPSGSNGEARKLQLDRVGQAGIAFGGLMAYPATVFGYTFRDNRVDHDGSNPQKMRHNRLNRVTNPFGGRVDVTYFQQRGCTQAYRPQRWDLNDRDCFPQSMVDRNNVPHTAVFYKYLVQQVVESPGQGSPAMTTTYSYRGTPAWAYDYGAFAEGVPDKGWTGWRGYGEVLVTKGTAKTQQRVFRGMDDDLAMEQVGGVWCPCGRRDVWVETFDRTPFEDHRFLTGRVVEERQLGTLDGRADQPLTATVYEYTARVTADTADRWDPTWAGVSVTTERVAVPGGFREKRTSLSYDEHLQPASTLAEGWGDVQGDERCTLTTYATDPARWMFSYPATNTTVAGAPGSGATLSVSQTYYDGAATLGVLGARALPTRQRSLIEAGRWAETTTDYDADARPTRVTDPVGAVTTTAYTPATGNAIPTRTTVTNALGHRQITDWFPEFGVPHKETDPNGNVTEYTYDALGRTIQVWQPTEPRDFAHPSWAFFYDHEKLAVKSQRLVSPERTGDNVRFLTSWAIYDGFLRERQVQTQSPVSGKVVVAETTYDDRGLPRDETVEQALPGTPGVYIPGGSSWANRTRHVHDEVGRKVRQLWFRGASVHSETTTEYTADTVTVTGPEGHRVRERLDGLGRTVAVEEWNGTAWVTSRYGYDLADNLTSVTDPAGNRIIFTYNAAGWRVSQADPNRGAADFAYDDAGKQLSATDGKGNVIHTQYDRLGRQVARRAGAPDGQLLASWEYDTAPGGVGQLHREITHTTGGAWISETTAYDARGRARGTKMTVPSSIRGLGREYEYSQIYDRADRVTTMALPAVGGLPAELVATRYNGVGLPEQIEGIERYAWAEYDDRGRRTALTYGHRPGTSVWMAARRSFDLDQRLAVLERWVDGSGEVSRHELGYDKAGTVTERRTTLHGSSWRECYRYDPLRRLTSAFTVDAAATCAAGTPGTGGRPYRHAYAYTPDGKLTERTEDGLTSRYDYPASGQPRPHAPSRVGTGTYTWDATGNLTQRTVNARTETFAWDVHNRLSSVDGGAGQVTTFVYSAGGDRLLRSCAAPD